MKEQISSLIELRISVKGTEHECDYGKGYGYSANSRKLKNCHLISILFSCEKHKIYQSDQSAEHICQHRIKLEVAYAACLQSSLSVLSGEHKYNSRYRQSDNNEIKDKFRCRLFTVAHKLIINRSVLFFVPETVIHGTNLCASSQNFMKRAALQGQPLINNCFRATITYCPFRERE